MFNGAARLEFSILLMSTDPNSLPQLGEALITRTNQKLLHFCKCFIFQVTVTAYYCR